MKNKLIVILLFVCSLAKGQGLFMAQNASDIGCDTTATEVTIGTQTWMRKNLDVVKYNDNTGIPKVTDAAAWAALTTPAYCWYNNDSVNYAATYGAFYNWYAVNTGKLCPTGWHVPDTTEFNTLINYLGGSNIAGGKLKIITTGGIYWQTPNTGASDSVCFGSIPAGIISNTGYFAGASSGNYFWTNTPKDANTSYYFRTYYNTRNTVKNYFDNKEGHSVRCIKD